jgi:hypothetical protein
MALSPPLFVPLLYFLFYYRFFIGFLERIFTLGCTSTAWRKYSLQESYEKPIIKKEVKQRNKKGRG